MKKRGKSKDKGNSRWMVVGSIFLLFMLFFLAVQNETIQGSLAKIFQIFSKTPVSAPSLLTPANNSIINSSFKFSWTKVSRANTYQLQVSPKSDASFTFPVINISAASTSYAPTSQITNGSYRWRVAATNKFGSGPYSNAFLFEIAPLAPITPPITNQFTDDFSAYTANNCFTDGGTFGPWKSVYNGFGCNKIETDGTNKWLHEAPKAPASLSETHASLVTGPSFSGPLTYEVKSITVQQLRTGTPNPWEVSWILWHYTDNSHFYYFIAKPNGWELGKEDPAYPGNQRYLATGSSPKYPIGTQYTIKITQDSSNRIIVFVNGAQIVSFVDTERPYTSGRIGLYDEDAHVHFDDVKVTQP
ncbi:MAG: family 16 glycoside hydrolase [Nanoarchaeota archaeon]